jgi:hypothetical protein
MSKIGVAWKERTNMDEISRKKKEEREAAIPAYQVSKDNEKPSNNSVLTYFYTI